MLKWNILLIFIFGITMLNIVQAGGEVIGVDEPPIEEKPIDTTTDKVIDKYSDALVITDNLKDTSLEEIGLINWVWNEAKELWSNVITQEEKAYVDKGSYLEYTLNEKTVSLIKTDSSLDFGDFAISRSGTEELIIDKDKESISYNYKIYNNQTSQFDFIISNWENLKFVRHERGYRIYKINKDTETEIYYLKEPVVYNNNSDTMNAWLTYNKGILTVSTSQWFLDEEMYPYIIDPTFTQPLNQTSFNLNVTTEPNNKSHLSIDASNSPYDRLVAYYSFDTDENRITYDYTANSNDGTYGVGFTPIDDCPFGKCNVFNSTANIKISVPPAESINNIQMQDNSSTGGMTVTFWANASSSNALRYIMAKGPHTNNAGSWDISYTSANSRVTFFKEGTDLSVNANNVLYATGRWYHVAVVWNGTNRVAFYSNATLIGNVTGSGGAFNSDAGNNLTIGGTQTGNLDSFNGSIDEVMIFNRSLTGAEISAIFNNQSQRFYKSGNIQTPSITIGTGNDSVNVSISNINKNISTNVSLRVYDGISYSSIQNITQNINSSHSISTSATSISSNITLLSESYGYYTPLVYGTIVTDVYGTSGPPPSNSCTYSSGNWIVQCSDFCNITSNVNLGGNNLSVNGTGRLTISNANITNFNKVFIEGQSSSNMCIVSGFNGGLKK